MRLLKRERSSRIGRSYKFSLIEFQPPNVPPIYAILSHRWGPDEVTLKDIESKTAKRKPGYRKLEFCANQAARDGIVYFWIDTCCIDKANNTELSTAINSMFKWYQNATKCYVYLPDVSVKNGGSTWVQAFEASAWFTRGWTLQELIAPRVVEFFSVEGERLGDKKSFEERIHRITKIPVEAIQGSSLAQFSVGERFRWAEGRHTTVEEDTAYCLLGVFDVHMPLLYGEGQQKALARLERKAGKLSDSTLVDTSASLPVDNTRNLSTVPFERNSRFTGRETELAQLERQLFASSDQTSTLAVTGLGGLGKTALVVEFLYRTRVKHPDCTVLWIAATSHESLHQGYRSAARSLNVAGCESEDANIEMLVQQHLSRVDVGRWLLVFDNADNIDIWTTSSTPRGQESTLHTSERSRPLKDRLPRSRRGCIIFTTRDRKAAVKLAGPNILSLSVMDEEVAAGLLSKYLNSSRFTADHHQDITKLRAELAYLPLAIVQAATYIIENDITVAEYVQLLADKEEEVIALLSTDFEDLGRYQEVKNPIATTWLISFEQIQKHDHLAAEYLSFMACIHPKDIPQSLLPPAPSQRRQTEAIGTLTAYSFVNKRPTDGALTLHRLVHLATRNWLRTESMLTSWLQETLIRVEQVFPNFDHSNREVWRMYMPHALQILKVDQSVDTTKQRKALVLRCGQCLYRDGRWDEAETYLSQVVEGDALGRSEDNVDPAESMYWLAKLYRRQGRYADAESLLLQVLESDKVIFGAESLSTLLTMGELGALYRRQGRLTEAEELILHVLEAQTRLVGSEHRETLSSSHEMALIYEEQGRLLEAEALYVRIIEASERVISADHPDCINSSFALAKTWKKLGRDAQAKQLAKECVQRIARVLGTQHSWYLYFVRMLREWEAEQPGSKQLIAQA